MLFKEVSEVGDATTGRAQLFDQRSLDAIPLIGVNVGYRVRLDVEAIRL